MSEVSTSKRICSEIRVLQKAAEFKKFHFVYLAILKPICVLGTKFMKNMATYKQQFDLPEREKQASD
jgi:hypothetical protein